MKKYVLQFEAYTGYSFEDTDAQEEFAESPGNRDGWCIEVVNPKDISKALETLKDETWSDMPGDEIDNRHPKYKNRKDNDKEFLEHHAEYAVVHWLDVKKAFEME